MNRFLYIIITIAIIFLPCWIVALVFIDHYNLLMNSPWIYVDSINYVERTSSSSAISSEVGGADSAIETVVDASNDSVAITGSDNIIKFNLMLNWVIMCESSGKHDDVWGSAGEYGLLQYKEDSFYWLADKYNFVGDWKNRDDQIDLFILLTDEERYQHWTCVRKYQNNN